MRGSLDRPTSGSRGGMGSPDTGSSSSLGVSCPDSSAISATSSARPTYDELPGRCGHRATAAVVAVSSATAGLSLRAVAVALCARSAGRSNGRDRASRPSLDRPGGWSATRRDDTAFRKRSRPSAFGGRGAFRGRRARSWLAWRLAAASAASRAADETRPSLAVGSLPRSSSPRRGRPGKQRATAKSPRRHIPMSKREACDHRALTIPPSSRGRTLVTTQQPPKNLRNASSRLPTRS